MTRGSFQLAAGDITYCGHCRRRLRVQFDTDVITGKLLEVVEQCTCPESRRLAGICRDCPRPVEGAVGRALRCAACKRAAALEASRRWRERNPDQVEAANKAHNAKRRAAEGRAQRREWEREYRNRPEVKERRRKQRRRIALKHPERKAEQHRRYKERYPERVREQQQRANERRAEAKREYSRLAYTKYASGREVPRCEDCARRIPWSGRGRPHKRCEECDPGAWAAARARENKRPAREVESAA